MAAARDFFSSFLEQYRPFPSSRQAWVGSVFFLPFSGKIQRLASAFAGNEIEQNP